MSWRPELRVHRRQRRVGFVALGLAGLLALSACGGSSEPPAEAATATTSATATTTTVAEPEPATTPPTTVPDPTTSAAPATTTTRPASTTTTIRDVTTTTETVVVTTTTSTLVVDLPEEPIAPPLDTHAREPVIEVGAISIPKLGVDMTMYEGIRMTTLDYGPGHWPGTAMPGQPGNVVVAGHRTSSHRVFRDVDQLVAGDEVVFRDGAGVHTYAVDRIEIVPPDAIWIVNPTETATATLFACHPPGSTAQRIVVFADHVSTTSA